MYSLACSRHLQRAHLVLAHVYKAWPPNTHGPQEADIYIYIYTTILPLWCTDGKYFYYISGTALFSGTNYDNFESIAIFVLHFGYTKSTQESTFKWK